MVGAVVAVGERIQPAGWRPEEGDFLFVRMPLRAEMRRFIFKV